MNNKYKYISTPYSLEELIKGNPIFKVQCELINDLYDLGYEDNVFDSKIIETEHLELIFNEFLNILSLLMFDNYSINETLKKLTICNNELAMFDSISNLIPYILDNIAFNVDYSETILKTQKYLKKESQNVNNKSIYISDIVKEKLSQISKKYTDALYEVLNKDNIKDLTSFFDLYHLNLINDVSIGLNTKSKRKVNTIINKNIISKTDKVETHHTSLQVCLFEEIITLKNWGELSATKKGQLLSLLIGKNDSNIKKVYLEMDKKISGNKSKFLDDKEKASELLKEILG